MGVRVFFNLTEPNRRLPTGPSARWSSALALVGFIGLCFLVGSVAGKVTDPNVSTWYESLRRPPGTPPNWVFPVVWSFQYLLIGTAAWMVWREPNHKRALWIWGWGLFFNFLWSPAFFGLHSPGLGLVAILPLLATIVLCIRAFARIKPLAAALLVPYLIWGSYAAYLNIGFFVLNLS